MRTDHKIITERGVKFMSPHLQGHTQGTTDNILRFVATAGDAYKAAWHIGSRIDRARSMLVADDYKTWLEFIGISEPTAARFQRLYESTENPTIMPAPTTLKRALELLNEIFKPINIVIDGVHPVQDAEVVDDERLPQPPPGRGSIGFNTSGKV